ncbi:MAG: cytochrome c oxidase subunit II [Chloroflexota bacterium]|nr:cytochrome c oxidase subunit II [Chloroflexota bacterium]
MVLLLLTCVGCGQPMSLVDTSNPRAAETTSLWWFMLSLGLATYILTLTLLALALRASPVSRLQLSERGRHFVLVGCGILAPVVILTALLVADLRTLVSVTVAAEPDLVVEVVGHQFWWEVRYPDQGLATANVVHLPVGRRVLLRLISADVIHSFWVPRLAGKTDLNPGLVTTTWLHAAQPGLYRGQCAEYCGTAHAHMFLALHADPPADFSTWLDEQQ